MIITKKIKGDNIYLQSLTLKNISKNYISWLNDKEINKFLETRHSLHDRQSIKKFIINCNKSENTYLLGMFCSKTDNHIGNIKLGPIKIEHNLGYISLFIGNKNYLKKGISTEAIKILSHYAFDNLNLNKLVAGMYSKNIKSTKSFLKVGFKKEGLRKKHYKLDENYEDILELGLHKNDLKK